MERKQKRTREEVDCNNMNMLRNADGGGGVIFSGKKRYEGVRCNVISVTRGWVGVQFPEKKHYITLEWPLISSK